MRNKKNSNLHVRIPEELKTRAEAVFLDLGMVPASGYRLLLSLLVEGRLPLSPLRPVPAPIHKMNTDNIELHQYSAETLKMEAMAGHWKRGYYEP